MRLIHIFIQIISWRKSLRKSICWNHWNQQASGVGLAKFGSTHVHGIVRFQLTFGNSSFYAEI